MKLISSGTKMLQTNAENVASIEKESKYYDSSFNFQFRPVAPDVTK
jgi:hypothetical protein